MAGAIKHVWVFSFLSLMVLFAFVPPSAAVQGKNHLDQPQGLEKLGANHSVVLPVSKYVKKRKEPLVKAPADQAMRPAIHEESRWIRSVSAPAVFSYAVVQQPQDSPYYVSTARNLVTEFGLAKKYGNIGLVAHNDLAGQLFSELDLGQEIYIIYKDGHTDRYTVSAIYRFRALEPTKTESKFVDLESEKVFSAHEVFEKMYTGERHVTLQTCINANGDQSWGRLFVIALPVTEVE